MSTTLENTNYINIFDAKLKSYNNIFFKTLQDGGLLNETTDIKNDANALNIGGANSYSTDQFNNFIRNIINFKIKNYTDLGTLGTNLEFVNKVVTGGTTTYSFNNDVRDNIIDTLKILNVFVDILEAYKYCIDNTGKAGATFDTCYYDDINIERIEVVSSTTRIYVSSAPVPDINTYKNVGYIRNTRTGASATPNNVLYLSIQSFHTGLSDAKNNYNDIFNKTLISGTYNSSTENSTPVIATIFDASVTNIADPQSTEIAKKDYAMHLYEKTTIINRIGLTRIERNKNVVSLLLKCLFNIDPKFRKQSVYALYYYYKFVQLYATLIINISNVMYANFSDSANPIRIDSYNTGTEISVTAIEVIASGVGYGNSSQNTLRIQSGGSAVTQATAKAIANAQGDIITGSSAINIMTNGSGYTSAPNVDFSTALHTKKSNAVTANTAASTGADAAYTAASDTYYAAVNAVNAEIFKLSSSSLTTDINTSLRASINTSLTIGNYAASSDAATLAAAKTAASITTTTFDAYINALIAERKAYLSGTPLTSDNINTEILRLSSSSLTNTIDKSLRTSIVSQLTSANYEDAGTIKSDAPTEATIKTTAKAATTPAITTATFDAYINALIAERKAYLILEKKLILKNTAAAALQTANALPTDAAATFKATIVPLAYQNTTKTQIENIDRFKDVFNDIETKIVDLITGIKAANDPETEESFVIVKSGTSAKIKAGSTNNVVIMIPKTDAVIYNKLIKYNDINNLVNDCSIYDKQNKKYYDILKISTFTSSGVEYFGIEINAVFVKDPTKENIDEYYKYEATTYASIPASETAITAAGDFLEIKRKDINALKNNYINNKKAIDELNANISLNTNRVNNQKNLYETQYNKNVFLSRQILTYNILICTIIVVLIGINVFKIDKPLVKSISLACLGIIILLFIIYFMSNITYIETFAVDTANINKLKNDPALSDITARNTRKVVVLKTEIDKLNAQFIRYFETIMIKLPTADNNDFYKEISSVINADIENKTYLDKILDFNSSQGNTNMDTLKYELENNKLYILTLLISSIIFIGLYNIYINYINDDKYLSLMIFIAIIIFIVIGAYYIINSNRRVRTIHKNIYWGPQSSESF
jgi:hypothetical protein